MVDYRLEDAKRDYNDITETLRSIDTYSVAVGDEIPINTGNKIVDFKKFKVLKVNPKSLKIERSLGKTYYTFAELSKMYNRFLKNYPYVCSSEDVVVNFTDIQGARSMKPLGAILNGHLLITSVSQGGKYSKFTGRCLNCNQEATTSPEVLKCGYLSCSCGSVRYKTVSMGLEEVHRRLEGTKYRCNSISSDLNLFTDHLKLECSMHGVWNTTSLNSFLKGARCPSCSKNTYDGFYQDRVEDLDYLYIIKFVFNGFEVFKIGRSFSPNVRWRDISDNVQVLSLYTGKHEDVYNCEKFIQNSINHLRIFKSSDKNKPKGYSECFSGIPEEVYKLLANFKVEEVIL